MEFHEYPMQSRCVPLLCGVIYKFIFISIGSQAPDLALLFHPQIAMYKIN